VRVNAVAPAVVKTRFAVALYEGREAEAEAEQAAEGGAEAGAAGAAGCQQPGEVVELSLVHGAPLSCLYRPVVASRVDRRARMGAVRMPPCAAEGVRHRTAQSGPRPRGRVGRRLVHTARLAAVRPPHPTDNPPS